MVRVLYLFVCYVNAGCQVKLCVRVFKLLSVYVLRLGPRRTHV